MTDQQQSTIDFTADSVQRAADGSTILTGAEVSLRLPSKARRFYYHGWQSWALAAWVPLTRRVLPMRPAVMDPGQSDPAYRHEKRPHGSWFGAVELENGQVVFLGSLSLESHVALDGESLRGWVETGEGEWFSMQGTEMEVFERYAVALKARFGSAPQHEPQKVWCSWYSLYTEISEGRLLKILCDLGTLPREPGEAEPFQVFQVDDGWQKAVGDWEANAKFPSGMDRLAAQIRATGRVAGLWLAPLLAVPSSRLYREHRDWLLRDERGRLVSAGFNWGEPLYSLDTTHPEAQLWLADLMKKVRAWGYNYVKLDFLYAGALPGKRTRNMPREAAYRQALEIIRAALGQAYFLACGAPIVPSIGLCDGMRIGPDVSSAWADQLYVNLLQNFAAPGGQNALRTILHRLWLQPLYQTDPDVVYFGGRKEALTSEQQGFLKDLAQIAGFKATSEIPSWLTEEEKHEMVRFMNHTAQVQRLGRYCYRIDGREVDFAAHIDMPPLPGFWDGLWAALLDQLASIPIVLQAIDAIGRRIQRRMLKKRPV